ncbi:MAG TPA: tetratricopeptide repeat protein [Polyangia bacterium]|nr:tetratricopeptide repeat protein [Polyangia bacterium]
MSRKRAIGILLTSCLLLTGSIASAKKKKQPAAEGGGGDFQPEAGGGAPTGDQPSKVLDRALKLYDGEDYYSSSIELSKVIEGESGDSEPNKQKAEFWMGKALYNMKFYSASLSYFDKIVQKGPSHAYYNATLKWLASLNRQLPESTGILDKIGKYNRAELDQPALEKVRDELYFLLGKFYYQKGQFKEAVELFQAVPANSDFYVQAKLFEGATYVRQYQAKPAVDAFKEVLRTAAQSDDPHIKPYEDIANLSLARTFYSTGQYDLAVKYFDRVSEDAFDWANSLFESSWANFMLKDKGYSKALGNIHTIQAPFFDEYIKPESVAEGLTVKATIYFYSCQYDRAEEAINDFNAVYPDVFQELKKLITGTQDNGELYEIAVKIRKQTSGLPEIVERAARGVLGDQTLSRRFDYVKELDAELKRYDKADASWKSTNIAQNVFADLTLQRSLAVNEAGDLARRRIKRLTEELSQLIKRVIKIEYEILAGQKGELEEEVKQEQQVVKGGGVHRGTEIRADDEHVIWPFNGEYWRDELGYYRVRIANKCGGAAPEGAPSTGETPAAAPAEGAGDTGAGAAGGDTGGGAAAGGDVP